MSDPIPVNLAVEDALSNVILRRVLEGCGGPWAIGSVYSRGGIGYLQKMIGGFNNAARTVPFAVLADLDAGLCAPAVVAKWLPNGPASNLMLRFAVREVEAWLLADSDSVAKFLGVRSRFVPDDVESLADPKRELVQLARRSKKRDIVADLVPRAGSTALVGRNYNARLAAFVQTTWNPSKARVSANSLDRAMTAFAGFRPSWS
jgi:hypothetical protein